jgi:uncharacterized protein DUF1566
MTLHRSSIRALLSSFLLALGATSASAQTVANGPYYATPSWDQTLPASTRFIVLANMNSEAVLDRETGLVWERSPSATAETFDRAAFFLCNSKNVGGRLGWRIPTIWELTSLIDPTQPAPKLPAGHPFNVSGDLLFWTNAPFSVGFGATSVYVVTFNSGAAGTVGPDQFHRAWCVRGAGGVGPVSPALQ